MNTLNASIDFEQIPGPSPWSVLLVLGGAMIIALMLGSCYVYEVRDYGIWFLAIGASVGIICGLAALQAFSFLSPERFDIADANTRSREVAQKAIVTSLLDAYQVESVHPLDGEGENSLTDCDGTDLDGVWCADWITLSLENDPLIAPQADVVLADGNIVTWGVIVDGESGTARFVNRVEGSTVSIAPTDVLRTGSASAEATT
jgi:hypothetical protein